MVKFVPLEVTLPLRSKVLRNGKPLEECIFPTDKIKGVFHLAYDDNQDIASTATFFPQQYRDYTELGYQLRGMATDHPSLGKGYGKQIIKFAVEYIKNTNAQYIWCNARTSAVKFYQKMGFEIASEAFEIAGVGPHYEMILKL